MQELFEEMAKDSENILPKTEKLKEISELVSALRKTEAEIDELEEKLKVKNAELLDLSSNKIPDLFDELNLCEFKLSDGAKIEVRRKFAAAITEANKPKCFDWLIKNGHESLIKHDVVVKIPKDSKKLLNGLEEYCHTSGLFYDDKEYVHAQTLQAFVKEQKETDSDFPDDLFSVYPVRITKIK